LKRRTTALGAPTNHKAIEQAWYQAWKDLPQEQIQQWMAGIPRLYDSKRAMSTKKVYRASNVAGQALESRGSSLHCSLSIEKLKTNLLMVRIATMRLMLRHQMRSKSVLDYMQFRWALDLLVPGAKIVQFSDF
jgi:hypothetical protein